MLVFYLIACLSTTLITNVSGIFSPFSSFPGFPSFPNFPNFPNPFGSSFGSPFGSGFPFSQSFGSPFSSDDPFASSPPSFPFQSPTPSFFSSSPTTGSASSSSSLFPSPFNRGFSGGSFGFPSFPSFPSFTDFANGLASGDLKGNGFKVTSTSSGSGAGGKPGQVIQTIKVEKIGTENGPGEKRRIVQTITASGPLVPTKGSNSQKSAKGNNQVNRLNQRPVFQRPNNKNKNQQQNVNQHKKPQRFSGPTTTPVVPPTGLTINGTQSTPSQQSNILNNSAGRPTTNQLLINHGNSGTGSTSSSNMSSSSTITTAGNTVDVNKSTPSLQSIGSQNSKVNGDSSSVTSFNSVNSDQSAVAKNGITVRRVDSSGRIINGF